MAGRVRWLGAGVGAGVARRAAARAPGAATSAVGSTASGRTSSTSLCCRSRLPCCCGTASGSRPTRARWRRDARRLGSSVQEGQRNAVGAFRGCGARGAARRRRDRALRRRLADRQRTGDARGGAVLAGLVGLGAWRRWCGAGHLRRPVAASRLGEYFRSTNVLIALLAGSIASQLAQLAGSGGLHRSVDHSAVGHLATAGARFRARHLPPCTGRLRRPTFGGSAGVVPGGAGRHLRRYPPAESAGVVAADAGRRRRPCFKHLERMPTAVRAGALAALALPA